MSLTDWCGYEPLDNAPEWAQGTEWGGWQPFSRGARHTVMVKPWGEDAWVIAQDGDLFPIYRRFDPIDEFGIKCKSPSHALKLMDAMAEATGWWDETTD